MPFHCQCHHVVLSLTCALSPFFAFYLMDIGRNYSKTTGYQVYLDNCTVNIFLYEGPNVVIVPPPCPFLCVCVFYCFGLGSILVFFICLVINCPTQCFTSLLIWCSFGPRGNTSLHENVILKQESGTHESPSVFGWTVPMIFFPAFLARSVSLCRCFLSSYSIQTDHNTWWYSCSD